MGSLGTGIFYTHTDGRHTGAHVSGFGWFWVLAVLALGYGYFLGSH